MDDTQILAGTLKFHGHRCWASVVAHAYRRVVGDKIMCIPCSGYDR